jgi:hypothetical protein
MTGAMVVVLWSIASDKLSVLQSASMITPSGILCVMIPQHAERETGMGGNDRLSLPDLQGSSPRKCDPCGRSDLKNVVITC